MKYILIIYAVVIHLLFFSSAIETQSFDIFFAQGNVHEWQGVDFYQVTNGAYAWLRIGNLSGDLPEGVPG